MWQFTECPAAPARPPGFACFQDYKPIKSPTSHFYQLNYRSVHILKSFCPARLHFSITRINVYGRIIITSVRPNSGLSDREFLCLALSVVSGSADQLDRLQQTLSGRSQHCHRHRSRLAVNWRSTHAVPGEKDAGGRLSLVHC